MADIYCIDDNMALQCAALNCGSVNFALLRSGKIECNQCGTVTEFAWDKGCRHNNPNSCSCESITSRVEQIVTGRIIGGSDADNLYQCRSIAADIYCDLTGEKFDSAALDA